MVLKSSKKPKFVLKAESDDDDRPVQASSSMSSSSPKNVMHERNLLKDKITKESFMVGPSVDKAIIDKLEEMKNDIKEELSGIKELLEKYINMKDVYYKFKIEHPKPTENMSDDDEGGSTERNSHSPQRIHEDIEIQMDD